MAAIEPALRWAVHTIDALRGQRVSRACRYCGQMTNNFSGDPAHWSLEFPHREAPGVVQSHHVACVLKRLAALDEIAQQPHQCLSKAGACGQCSAVAAITK